MPDAARASTSPPVERVTGSPLDTLTDLARRHHLTDVERRCAAASEQAGSGRLSVAVLGQFKAGKSSLLNSLLGEDVLPVQAIPATAAVTEVRFGADPGVTVTRTGGTQLAVDTSDLASWVTEEGNPGNVKGVDRATIDSPALADLDRLILVDTPGTGSSIKHNTRTSVDWLPRVQAAVVAIAVTQPLAAEDLALVAAVRRHTPRLIVVLTKIDLISTEELSQVVRHVTSHLHQHLSSPPTVLTFSVAPAHLELREHLRAVLREWNDSASAASAETTAHRVRSLAGECRSYLLLAEAAASQHESEVGALRTALAAESTRLQDMRRQARTEVPAAQQLITDRALTCLTATGPATTVEVGGELARILPTWSGSLAKESSRFRAWLQKSLVARISPAAEVCAVTLDPLRDRALDPARRMGEAFVQRLGELVASATGRPLNLPVPELQPAPLERVDVVVDTVFDSQLEILSWAIPMTLARPFVHRHFIKMVPWQVEKNLTRAGYRLASAAVHSVESAVEAHIEALAESVRTCQILAESQPDDLPMLRADLRRIDDLLLATTAAPDAGAPDTSTIA